MTKKTSALKKINWRMGLWLPALIILSNPNLHALDLLPDAIGYALLLAALRRVCVLDESFGEVARAFRRMALLSVARMLGLVWVYTLTGASEQPTLLLIICFAIGVLELMTILPACNQLFRGLSYMATRLDGHIVFEGARKRRIDRLTEKLRQAEEMGTWDEARRRRIDRKLRRLARRHGGDITDKMCFACQSFAIFKTVLCVLPELAALSQAPYDAGAADFNWYAYINGFRAMAWLAASIIGIVWLCRVIAYCCRIAKDMPFWERLAEKCEEDARLHPERVPQGRLRRAMLCISVACAFCINFRMDGINYLPGFITPIALLVALAFLWPYLTTLVRAICTAVFSAQTVALVYCYASDLHFFTNYDIVQYGYNWSVREAYAKYVTNVVLMEIAFMLLSLAAIAMMLFTLIDRYAGTRGMATHQYTAQELGQLRRKALKRRLLVPMILYLIMVIVRSEYFVYLPEEAMVWVADFAVAAVFAVFAVLRAWEVKDSLNVELMVDAHAKPHGSDVHI